ncbi:hypothetical protein B0H13DRAFT_2308957 [Mycena leptocephala]|nr:hypothetical protein B0H13DRAFT_2308957 [Mycena leptocephala]
MSDDDDDKTGPAVRRRSALRQGKLQLTKLTSFFSAKSARSTSTPAQPPPGLPLQSVQPVPAPPPPIVATTPVASPPALPVLLPSLPTKIHGVKRKSDAPLASAKKPHLSGPGSSAAEPMDVDAPDFSSSSSGVPATASSFSGAYNALTQFRLCSGFSFALSLFFNFNFCIYLCIDLCILFSLSSGSNLCILFFLCFGFNSCIHLCIDLCILFFLCFGFNSCIHLCIDLCILFFLCFGFNSCIHLCIDLCILFFLCFGFSSCIDLCILFSLSSGSNLCILFFLWYVIFYCAYMVTQFIVTASASNPASAPQAPRTLSQLRNRVVRELKVLAAVQDAGALSGVAPGDSASSPFRAHPDLFQLLSQTIDEVVAVAPSDIGTTRRKMGEALLPVGLVLVRELALRATIPLTPMLQIFSEENKDHDSDDNVLQRAGTHFGIYISFFLRSQFHVLVDRLRQARFTFAENMDSLGDGYRIWNKIWDHVRSEGRAAGLPRVPTAWIDWARSFWGDKAIKALSGFINYTDGTWDDAERGRIWRLIMRHMQVFGIDVAGAFEDSRGRFPKQDGDIYKIPQGTVALFMSLRWHVPKVRLFGESPMRYTLIANFPTVDLLDDLLLTDVGRPVAMVGPGGLQHDLFVQTADQAEELVGCDYRGKGTCVDVGGENKRGRLARYQETGFELWCAASRPTYQLRIDHPVHYLVTVVTAFDRLDVNLSRGHSCVLRFRKSQQKEVVAQLAKLGGYNMPSIGKMLSVRRHENVLIRHIKSWWDAYIWRVLYQRLLNPQEHPLRVKRRKADNSLGRLLKIVDANGKRKMSFEGGILALMRKEGIRERPGGPDDDKAVARFLRIRGIQWRIDFPEDTNDDPTPASLNRMAEARAQASTDAKGKGKAKATSDEHSEEESEEDEWADEDDEE